MRKMKDCGIDWIGQVPNDWEITRLRFTAEIVRGGSPRPIESFISDDGEGFNWVKIGDADKDNKYITHTSCKIIRSGLSKTRMVHANDLILTNSMSFGEPYIMGIDGCIHDGWVAFSKYKGIVKEFLYWCLLSDLCRIQFEKQVDGGVVQNLNIDKIGNTIVFLPPIDEQKKIADFLDEKCGEIDSIRSDVQREIEILNDYKKSVITEAVTKGLNPKAILKDSGIEWIGKIPEGWNVKKLKYVTKIRTEKALFSPDKDLYIGLENIVSWSNKLIETETEYIAAQYDVCKKGDVLFSKLRPYLAKAVISPKDAFCTGELLNFKFFEGEKKFLWYYLLLEQFVEIVNASTYGAKMPRANADFIINQPIILPPLSEQKAIADYLDEKCSEIDATIADKQKQLETLDEYKKSLIFEYVTGKKECV